jgi:hypothetical protein
MVLANGELNKNVLEKMKSLVGEALNTIQLNLNKSIENMSRYK